MDTSRAGGSTGPDPSNPDPSEFDGGQPQTTDEEGPEVDGPDVLFPDTLRPTTREDALPAADEADLVEQRVEVGDDDEDERRG
ncbi:hypothetical protein [Terrabacter carboxydivorans]